MIRIIEAGYTEFSAGGPHIYWMEQSTNVSKGQLKAGLERMNHIYVESLNLRHN